MELRILSITFRIDKNYSIVLPRVLHLFEMIIKGTPPGKHIKY